MTLTEELEEAGLISSQKREDKDRKGLHSEEYWKVKLPGTEAITWKPLPQEPLELNLGPPNPGNKKVKEMPQIEVQEVATEPKISPDLQPTTCGQCLILGTPLCPKEKPELIRPEATFADSCPDFKSHETSPDR